MAAKQYRNPFTGRLASRATINRAFRERGVTLIDKREGGGGLRYQTWNIDTRNKSEKETRDLINKALAWARTNQPKGHKRNIDVQLKASMDRPMQRIYKRVEAPLTDEMERAKEEIVDYAQRLYDEYERRALTMTWNRALEQGIEWWEDQNEQDLWGVVERQLPWMSEEEYEDRKKKRSRRELKELLDKQWSAHMRPYQEFKPLAEGRSVRRGQGAFADRVKFKDIWKIDPELTPHVQLTIRG